jgi:ABC transport system ATP-binding/permease protein
MKEKSLNSIVDFFALVGNKVRFTGPQFMANLVEVYLAIQFSTPTVEAYLKEYNAKAKEYGHKRTDPSFNWDGFFKSEIEAQCYIISREVQASDRLLVLIYLLELTPYIFDEYPHTTIESKFDKEELAKLAELLNFTQSDYMDCLAFVQESYSKIEGQNPVLCITDNKQLEIPGVKVEHNSSIEGQMIFMRINSVNTILYKVTGESRYEVNGHQIYKRRTNIFKKGAIIQIDGISTIYYNDIEKSLTQASQSEPLRLTASNIEYEFPGGNKGIHELGFSVNSGEMLAIMGGSGCGKTTLMNILIGYLKPTKGEVLLNQLNIHQNISKIKGYIGYVPQDDSLISELTAYENLYYNARLCLGNLTRETIENNADELLKELGLYEIRDLKVGSAHEKVISGGQRKRLNIAMELIRSPKILFLDEPTSGLSSSDSENIMQILKSSTFSGKMVIVNIHQPSSDVFKLFDKLLFLDVNGYPVYYGRSAQVMSYLKKSMRLVDAHESECQLCGNLNPDDIFHLVQSRKMNAQGEETTERIYSPMRWHRSFLRIWNRNYHPTASDSHLPALQLAPSKRIKQFVFYMVRNLKTKLADYQYLLLSFMLPPLLAVILSGFSRHSGASSFGSYVYGKNDNFPQFLLMSIIVALFVGMMSSSEEIIKDRGVLKRESFLGLSFVSYLLSKMLFLVTLSAFQMWTYSAISIHILEIPDQDQWLFVTLWVTACFANSLGLLISTLLKSLAAVYVTIPFLLIPQILLSGAVIQFDKINPSFSSKNTTPLVADFMVAKWAYESLMVDLFVDNDYTNTFYHIDKPISDIVYYRDFLCGELEANYFGHDLDDQSQQPIQRNEALLANGLKQLAECGLLATNRALPQHYKDVDFIDYLDSCRADLSTALEKLQERKDDLLMEIGARKLDSMKVFNLNSKINDLVLAKEMANKIDIDDDVYIRRMAPIYVQPNHNSFRNQLFVSTKWFGPVKLTTGWFNLIIISLFAIFNLVASILMRKYYRQF